MPSGVNLGCPSDFGRREHTFYEEMPDLHVVAAGSLLEFAIGEISVPVGRIQHLEMVPMTFLEVLWAIGNDAAAEIVAARPRLLPEATQGSELNYWAREARGSSAEVDYLSATRG